MVAEFLHENYKDFAINPDMRQTNKPREVFTSELRRRTQVENLSANESSGQREQTIQSLMALETDSLNVDKQTRSTKRRKIESKQTDASSPRFCLVQ